MKKKLIKIILFWTIIPFFAGCLVLKKDLDSMAQERDTMQLMALLGFMQPSGGGSTTPPDLLDNGDGTVSAGNTNLLWAKCSQATDGDTTYNGGGTGDQCDRPTIDNNIQYCSVADESCNDATTKLLDGTGTSSAWTTCNNLTLAGRSDWRVPTVAELVTIVDYSIPSPTISDTYFPGTGVSGYWSASTYVPSTTFAWYVTFSNGYVNYNSKPNVNYVRCVATGP